MKKEIARLCKASASDGATLTVNVCEASPEEKAQIVDELRNEGLSYMYLASDNHPDSLIAHFWGKRKDVLVLAERLEAQGWVWNRARHKTQMR